MMLEIYFNTTLTNLINVNNTAMILKLQVTYTTSIPLVAFNIPNNNSLVTKQNC
jgi:hypothetical protein